jgi:RNA polymerase sigma factor (sigma-70 family)
LNDKELEICIKKIQKKGDAKAFRKIYDQISPGVYFVCLRYMKDSVQAQEVLQQAFITVFEKIKQFKGDGNFEGWVKRIAVNTALQVIRKKSKTLWLDDYDQIETADEVIEIEIFEEVDNTEAALTLLNDLPEGYKTIINLSVLEDYSHKEIAEMLNISEGTSRSQLLRAKKKLKEMVLAHNDGRQATYR